MAHPSVKAEFRQHPVFAGFYVILLLCGSFGTPLEKLETVLGEVWSLSAH